MIYKTYQAIILLRNTLNIKQKKNTIEKIKKCISQCTRKIQIIDFESLMPLASKIDNCSNAWYVAMQFQVVYPGLKKRIKYIEEQLNTYSEILDFKILLKEKIDNEIQNSKKVYVVYEFDYGDFSKEIEARTTIFGAFMDKKRAKKVAFDLLQEGLDTYYISKYIKNLKNPFSEYDEVELYEKEDEDMQDKPVYYIKIEEVNFE